MIPLLGLILGLLIGIIIPYNIPKNIQVCRGCNLAALDSVFGAMAHP